MNNALLFLFALIAGGSGAWLLYEPWNLSALIAFGGSTAYIGAQIRRLARRA